MARAANSVTPDDVLRLSAPTTNFLCEMSADSYDIDFLSFTIEDYESKALIFEVSRDRPPKIDIDMLNFDENALRKIKYEFSEDVLRLPSIKTSLIFSVGTKPVERFRMIERHYFRNTLIKSFDFQFGFCIPGSTNTWDAVYAVPGLGEEMIQDMIANPHETTSDSFYFVGDELIKHNKASYSYIVEDRAQAKRSYDYLNPDKVAAGGKTAESPGEKAGTAGAKYADSPGVAEAKTCGGCGGGGGGAGSKAAAKYDDDVWSKETDYAYDDA
jgi:hypothetical protein